MKQTPLTTRLANDLSGTREQNGFGWRKFVNFFQFSVDFCGFRQLLTPFNLTVLLMFNEQLNDNDELNW